MGSRYSIIEYLDNADIDGQPTERDLERAQNYDDFVNPFVLHSTEDGAKYRLSMWVDRNIVDLARGVEQAEKISFEVGSEVDNSVRLVSQSNDAIFLVHFHVVRANGSKTENRKRYRVILNDLEHHGYSAWNKSTRAISRRTSEALYHFLCEKLDEAIEEMRGGTPGRSDN